MLAPTISTSLAVFPTTALVTAGVLGVLGVRLRRHSGQVVVRPTQRQPLAGAASPEDTVPAFDGNCALATMEDDDPDAKEGAMQLLDRWCNLPRSAWHALGVRALQAAHVEARAYTASQLVLEGIVSHHVLPMDAWLVRDFADTAWCSASEDGAPSSSAVEMAARRAVTNGALAMLARPWLPGEDFERLAMMVVR